MADLEIGLIGDLPKPIETSFVDTMFKKDCA